MSTTMSNGRARKSLADQIDRLDALLDGLAEGLNEAVADAVAQAVRQALAQVLTDPRVKAALAKTCVPAGTVTDAPSLAARVRSGCRRLWLWMASGVCSCAEVVRSVATRTGNGCRQAWIGVTSACVRLWHQIYALLRRARHGLRGTRHFIGALGAALAIGALVGVAAYHAGPWLASLTSGVGGFTSTGAAYLLFWLRRGLGSAATH